MSAVSYLAKKTLSKIFTGVAKELKEPIENIKIGIYYAGGSAKYEAYKGTTKEKDILLDDYLTVFDAGAPAIDGTIGQAGKKYADECKCEVADINIIMKHRIDEFPLAVLMAKGAKVRNIDIEAEFLNS